MIQHLSHEEQILTLHLKLKMCGSNQGRGLLITQMLRVGFTPVSHKIDKKIGLNMDLVLDQEGFGLILKLPNSLYYSLSHTMSDTFEIKECFKMNDLFQFPTYLFQFYPLINITFIILNT